MDDLPGKPCAECGKTIQTLWCPVWDTYLCMWCRARRTDLELSPGPKTTAARTMSEMSLHWT